MAVAVPFAMAATGASAAIGAAIGVSAGLVTAATGVLVGATGIGKSINKAASKVFGEDLVSFANIAGGIAMAAGWNPADTWASVTGGGAAGGGALAAPDLMTSDTGVGGASAGGAANVDLSTTDIGIGGASAGQPGGVEGLRSLERVTGAGEPAARSYESAVNAVTKPAAPISGKAGMGALSDVWDKLSERERAALITTGGQALAGAAQGWSRAKDSAKERAERRRREGVFQSGSGLTNTYGPRVPVTNGG